MVNTADCGSVNVGSTPSPTPTPRVLELVSPFTRIEMKNYHIWRVIQPGLLSPPAKRVARENG